MSEELNQSELIRQIETLIEKLKLSLSGNHGQFINIAPIKLKKERKFIGLTAKVYELVGEGFFDEPKTISDLQKKLKDGMINKPTTSLMAPLKLLVGKKILERNKPEEGIYNYIKNIKK